MNDFECDETVRNFVMYGYYTAKTFELSVVENEGGRGLRSGRQRRQEVEVIALRGGHRRQARNLLRQRAQALRAQGKLFRDVGQRFNKCWPVFGCIGTDSCK